MVSQAYKDLLTGGVWASSAVADRADPEEVGLNRADGWPVAYEQQGSGSEPERTVFNELDHELDAGLVDVAAYGVPTWDAEVNYTPASDAACFATTTTGLWLTFTATGPATGNATDPDAVGQTIWRRY